jgi:hypothetical protein
MKLIAILIFVSRGEFACTTVIIIFITVGM